MTILFCLLLAAWPESEGARVAREGAAVVEADFTQSWVTDASLERASEWKSLRKLTLDGTRVTDLGLEHLRGLENVREFHCRFCDFVTEDGVAHLRGWKKLEYLNLRGTKVTSKVFDHLAQLPALRRLDLSHTEIEDEGFEQLSNLERLEWLAIGANRLEGTALTLLKQVPTLRHLDVAGIQRVDSGIWGVALNDANLARLGELTQLTSLVLNGANISDRGLDRPERMVAGQNDLRDVSPLLRLKNLERIDVSRTMLTPQALLQLAELPRLKEIRGYYAPNLKAEAWKAFEAKRADVKIARD